MQTGKGSELLAVIWKLCKISKLYTSTQYVINIFLAWSQMGLPVSILLMRDKVILLCNLQRAGSLSHSRIVCKHMQGQLEVEVHMKEEQYSSQIHITLAFQTDYNHHVLKKMVEAASNSCPCLPTGHWRSPSPSTSLFCPSNSEPSCFSPLIKPKN